MGRVAAPGILSRALKSLSMLVRRTTVSPSLPEPGIPSDSRSSCRSNDYCPSGHIGLFQILQLKRQQIPFAWRDYFLWFISGASKY
jgi:hypothetical protein